MHILQVTPYFYPHFGGVESHVLGLSENLIKLGHEVEVVTSRYSRMPEIEKINGIYLARSVTLMNLVESRLSNMALLSIDFGVDIDPALLTKRALTDTAFREKHLNNLRAQAN